MESLRLPKNAVMSIGYDSMELLALLSGADLHQHREGITSVLDICAGCGIQGIFFAKVHDLHQASITFMDINDRACHFITANSCLNKLFSTDKSIRLTTIEADVFHPIKIQATSSNLDIGKFDFILSNPPFVAVPFAKYKSLTPSLYAIGGASDGMGLLRKLLKQVLRHLNENAVSKLLMVTELPNVEDSCILLQEMLCEEIPNRIRVAYIEQDVETAADYSLERENESGLIIQSRDWHVKHIRNRALVLISIEINISDQRDCLYCYQEKTAQSLDDAYYIDDEDLFLTRKGINFARQNLL
jgi:methylase of polypeptide subunit release factors